MTPAIKPCPADEQECCHHVIAPLRADLAALREENEKLITGFVKSMKGSGVEIRMLNSCCDSLRAEVDSKRKVVEIAVEEAAKLRAEVERKQAIIKRSCEDWADDDTRVKAIAAEFGIKECHDNCDAFKGVIEIAEEMAAIIRERSAEVERLTQQLSLLQNQQSEKHT